MKIMLDARMVVAKDFGMGRYIYNLLSELTQLDQQNEYLIMVNDDFLAGLIKGAKNFRLWRVNLKWLSLLEQFQLPGMIAKIKPDIYHACSFVVPLVQPCPVIATIYDLIHVRSPKRYSWLHRVYYGLVLNRALKNVRKIITISEFSKSDLISYYGLSTDKVAVAYPAVEKGFCRVQDPAWIEHFKKQRKLPERFMLYVGNRKKHKNLGCLFSAFGRLKNEHGCACDLVISGSEDSETRALLLRYNIEERVVFSGEVGDEELPLLYNAAALFVYPSLFEGFGLPPLEAMACGVPVVAAKASSLPEVLGQAALLFDPQNDKALAEAILKVLQDKNLSRELVQKGLERAKRYSWKECARQTLKVYQSVYEKEKVGHDK